LLFAHHESNSRLTGPPAYLVLGFPLNLMVLHIIQIFIWIENSCHFSITKLIFEILTLYEYVCYLDCIEVVMGVNVYVQTRKILYIKQIFVYQLFSIMLDK
jgi:hypothetical protein